MRGLPLLAVACHASARVFAPPPATPWRLDRAAGPAGFAPAGGSYYRGFQRAAPPGAR